MKFLSKIRFLPITIFFATLMLTVKVSDIWEGVKTLQNNTIEVAQVSAQTAQPEQQPDQQTDPEAADEGEETIAEDNAADEEDVDPNAASLLEEDPSLMTVQEIEVLQKLTARRKILVQREKELLVRAGLLEAAERRLDRKVQELQTLKTTISSLIITFDEQQDAKLKSLVKIYENMKPKDAARIFEDLELDTLLEVAERMKERKLAPVMAKMNPVKAREMTVELRRLRQLPTADQRIGG